jgi:hypothetical protein
LVAIALFAAFAVALMWQDTGAAKASKAPPFERVNIDRISLPDEIVDASQPAYSHDGRHLLFFANATTASGDLWLVGEDGSNPTNLTGGLSGKPSIPNPGEIEQPGLIQPFPDGKRVFFGPYGDPKVLECTPSVVDCRSKQILDVDLDGARPAGGIIPSGGAVSGPVLHGAFGARPQLSPDGNYVMFSDIRFDAIEVMVLAKLKREGDHYATSDGKVLNPAGPTSPTDKNTKAWSDSTALFESKTFIDGGKAITYVQVGGEAGGNPDIWKLDLATGKRTRLTYNPDWQEDHGTSPDGTDNVVSIDSTNTRYLDYLSLMPYRSFFDAWEIAPIAQIAVAGAARRACAPFAPRLNPGSGDMRGKLAGQVIQPYKGGDIRPSGNYQGTNMWKPDGTAVALSTQSFKRLGGAPYLEVAKFPDRRPSKPLPTVSSAPGSWAPSNTEYHGALGANLDITLPGLKSGSVTIHYQQDFLTTVDNTATYENYSDDGKTFINGTDRVMRTGTSSGGGSTEVITHLVMSGAHTGSLDRDITYVTGDPGTIVGSTVATYDGATRRNLETPQDRCDSIRKRLPRAIGLKTRVKTGKGNKLTVKVSAAYRGAGMDERQLDKRPVLGAVVTAKGAKASTNKNGVATIKPKTGVTRIHVSAGVSFRPATIKVRPVGRVCAKARTALKKAKRKGSLKQIRQARKRMSRVC